MCGLDQGDGGGGAVNGVGTDAPRRWDWRDSPVDGWCVAGRWQWSFAQGSSPGGQGHLGTEEGHQKIGVELNKGNYLHSRCFLYPVQSLSSPSFELFFMGVTEISPWGSVPSLSLQNARWRMIQLACLCPRSPPLCFLMYFLLLTQCQLRWRSECNSAEHSVLWWLNWHPCPIFHGHCYWIWGRFWSLDWIRKIPVCPWSNLAVPVVLWRTEEIPESHLQCIIIWRKATQLKIAWS